MKDDIDNAPALLPPVRAKATHRKQRSEQPQRVKLAPTQDRSRRRNEDILQAASELLQAVNIEDLSHSDIAQQAGISKAAIYYHYPTIAAIQRELAIRYDEELSEFLQQRDTRFDTRDWQTYLRDGANDAKDWMNRNRPACEALLGPRLTRENQLVSIEMNTKVGGSSLSQLRARYYMPDHPNLEEIISHQGEIIDLFWSRSYLSLGFIDDTTHEEGLRASLGYLKNYIPERLALREPGAAA
jgi:AcrR family transcriptional regulator